MLESSSRGRSDAAIQGPQGALRSPRLLRFARNDDCGSTQMQFALTDAPGRGAFGSDEWNRNADAEAEAPVWRPARAHHRPLPSLLWHSWIEGSLLPCGTRRKGPCLRAPEGGPSFAGPRHDGRRVRAPRSARRSSRDGRPIAAFLRFLNRIAKKFSCIDRCETF